MQVEKIKIGAMNITPLAKMMAKKMYAEQLAAMPVEIDTESWQAKIAAALLDDKPFEPVFKIEDRKVRIEEIIVREGKLTARMVPAS